MESISRRLFAAVAFILTACHGKKNSPAAQPAAAITEEDRALVEKFRDIYGGELMVDQLTDMPLTAIHRPNGQLFNIGIMGGKAGGGIISGYNKDPRDTLAVPKYLRMMCYAEGAQRNHNYFHPPVFDGTLIYETLVPVASRIPDAVLDRIRKYKGSLKLKLRLTPETILIGWEVANGKGYPWKRDKWGNDYSTDEDTLVGGDFREAKIHNGEVVRKGWYIDPKTGIRMETDF